MANLVLFETTESIIEILWDIALAFFIVRLACLYFLLTFLFNAAITYLALTFPQVTHPLAVPLFVPSLLLSSAVCASFVVSHFEVPPVAGFRLAIGAVATLLMVLAEGVVGLGRWKAGWGFGLGFGNELEGVTMMGLLASFALMPAGVMAFERRQVSGERKRTTHGHEEKNIVHAVPVVKVKEKRTTEEKTR